jgi:hypothetical protein
VTTCPHWLARALGIALFATSSVAVSACVDGRRDRERRLAQGPANLAMDVERLADLPRVLHESSGIAVSRQHPGVFWSHNDSGDGPVLYAIDARGRLRATVTMDGALAEDWEDIALAPCPMTTAGAAGASCLFVADTGNNDGSRSVLTIWVAAEPPSLAGGSARTTARAVRFRYPGVIEDSEALAVAPNGDIVLISKGRTGSIAVFRLRAADVLRALSTDEVLTAGRDGDVGIEPSRREGRLATGASFSPDGLTLAVRTYGEVFFFAPSDTGPGWRQVGPPCALSLGEPVGEAIAYLDERTLILTSERAGTRPGALHKVRCPAATPSSQ